MFLLHDMEHGYVGMYKNHGKKTLECSHGPYDSLTSYVIGD